MPGNLAHALSLRADKGLRLQRAWLTVVPEPLVSHTRPVRCAAGLLYVSADTPVWASRLRHQQTALITALRRDPDLRDLTEIQIRVVPSGGGEFPAAAVRPRSRLSAKAALVIKGSAASINHPKLRAALERLAERGGSTDKPKS